MEPAKPTRAKDDAATFSKSVEAKCGIGPAWDVISDVDNDPKYYEGLNSVKNVSKSGNVIEREVVVGFLKHSGYQIVTLRPKESVEVRMTKGPMIGTRTTSLASVDGSKTRIEVEWDVELRVPGFVQSMVKRELAKGTKRALNLIVKEAERAARLGQESGRTVA